MIIRRPRHQENTSFPGRSDPELPATKKKRKRHKYIFIYPQKDDARLHDNTTSCHAIAHLLAKHDQRRKVGAVRIKVAHVAGGVFVGRRAGGGAGAGWARGRRVACPWPPWLSLLIPSEHRGKRDSSSVGGADGGAETEAEGRAVRGETRGRRQGRLDPINAS